VKLQALFVFKMGTVATGINKGREILDDQKEMGVTNAKQAKPEYLSWFF
jgi:hypothetical protein